MDVFVNMRILILEFENDGISLFGRGRGGGVKTTPLAKILNNTKFGQAAGLLELFTEENLVLHVF